MSVTATETKTRVRVLYDTDPSNPRDNDNVGTMACWHRRYQLGDVQPKGIEPADYIAELEEGSLILPLFLYDHSGLTMRTSSFNDRWDSGQVGIIHVSPEKIKAEWGDGPDAREKAEASLTAEVEEYDTFLRGDVYGFIIEEGQTCDKGHMHWEQTDSCWGFFGNDPEKNGMTDHVPEALHAQLLAAAQSPESR